MNENTSEISIRIQDFGCFSDSGFFTVGQGLNTFIGINNAGKTALLFALAGLSPAMKGKDLPYPLGSVVETIKRYKRLDADPVIEVDIPMSGVDGTGILEGLCKLASESRFPEHRDPRDVLRLRWVLGNDEAGLCDVSSRVYSQGRLIERKLSSLTQNSSNRQSQLFIINEHPYGYSRPNTFSPPQFEVTMLPSRTDLHPFKFNDPSRAPRLLPTIFDSVVLLSTHRNPPARAQHNYAVGLDPVASNLAPVLATIQMSSPEIENGREVFDNIQSELKILFPEILRIRTEIIPSNRSGQTLDIEVKLDLTSGATVPLSHSGTGIQQVLTLLTGALVSKSGSLFLLDEPQSYLHPSAERGLIALLQRLGKERGHYFCIATHSPLFASHSRTRLYAVRASEESGSTVHSLSHAAEILDVLGINNPDLFTYSRVIFVEGASDEKVLRAIADLVLEPRSEHRLKIQPLGGDGILKSRSRAEFISLLHKANASEIHVPLRFVLDSNDWSKDERQRLQALSDPDNKPVVHFLDRPELENYLLQPQAVLNCINQRLQARSLTTKAALPEVENTIKANSTLKGSGVLAKIFESYDCDYSKNKDVELLLTFLLENDPAHLNPLLEELSDVMGATAVQKRPLHMEKRS